MLGAIPVILQVGGVILGIVFGFASFAGLVAGAIYIVKSRKITTNNNLADSAVASLTSANVALSSRLDLVEKDNEHCHELNAKQDLVIEQQDKRINDLTKWVTARDLVMDLADMVRAGFLALDVPADTLAAAVRAVDHSQEHP